MKKKILSLLAIFVLLFTNYAFAFTQDTNVDFKYQRKLNDETVPKLNSVAKILNEDTKFESKYNAFTSIMSKNYNNKDFSNQSDSIYTNIAQSSVECDYLRNEKYYIKDAESEEYLDRYISIKLPATSKKIQFEDNEFYIIYKDAVNYNGEKYNLKLQLNSISCDFEEDNEIFFHVGLYKKNGDSYEPQQFYPGIGASGTRNKVEVNVSQTILDSNGQEKPVNGLFVITDLDLEQGIAIENVEINSNNSYMFKGEEQTAVTDTIKYYKKQTSNNNFSTYIYSTTSENLSGNIGNAYVLVDDKSKLNMTYTFDTKAAHSTVGFVQVANYYKIDLNIYDDGQKRGNTITYSNIDAGANQRVEYSSLNDELYYIRRITINGEEIPLDASVKNSYTFSNVDKDYVINVYYEKKVTVQFNCQGGTAVASQTLPKGNKAFVPADTLKEGYTFRGWYTDLTYSTLYNFNTPVNQDITLYAKWEKNDLHHNITYIVLGNPDDNNATNPNKYEEGVDTTLTIKNPTKQGYTFSGWYENQELTGNPVTTLNVSNRTDDITLYGRWTINETPMASYTVNHYFEDENGSRERNNKKYKIVETQTINAQVNSFVTASAKFFEEGFIPEENSLSGTVLQDDSLSLDFYYNKIEYTVTFDTQGGTPVPSQQTKKYGELVTKPTDPTKNGYNFLYWYENINGIEVPYDFSRQVTRNKTLIAKWQEVIPEDVYHNINYIVDGEADNSAGNPERYKEGSTTTYTIYNPTKHGYTFSGWYDNQQLNGNKITTLDVSGKTADITLYGKFTKNKEPYSNYTINHYLEDEEGSVTKNNKKYKLDNKQTKSAETDSIVTENAHTYEGYEAENYSISGQVLEDGTLELNFYYNKKQYNITFDSKGGTKVDNQTKVYGEKVDEPDDPEKQGYKFLYWYEEIKGKKVIYDFDRAVNSDKKLIAEWEEIKIIPDEPKKEETVPTQKTDTTVAQKVIPNTGLGTAIIITIIGIICAFFGIRYFKLRNDMK